MDRAETIEFLAPYTSAHPDPPRLTVAEGLFGGIRLLMDRPNLDPLPFVLHRFSTAPANVALESFKRILRLTDGLKTRDISATKPIPNFVQPLLLEQVARRALAAQFSPDDVLQVWCFYAQPDPGLDLLNTDDDHAPMLFVCRTASGSFSGHGINATFEGRAKFFGMFSAASGWTVYPIFGPGMGQRSIIACITSPVDEDGNEIEDNPPDLDNSTPFTWRDFRNLLSMLAQLPHFFYLSIKDRLQRRRK